jgi:rod shape-determining protein MreC
VQDFGLRLISPLTAAFDGLGELVSGSSGPAQGELEAEIERLQVEIAALRQQAGRVAELEDALGFTENQPEQETLVARVTQRNSNNFAELVSINRGSDNGVREEMVVLSAQGSLVGKVIEVRGDTSIVRLITSPSLRVNVTIPSATDVSGVAQSNGSDELSLGLVPKDSDVKLGDSVVTSGLNGDFPNGLLVGTVSEVTDTDELFLRILIDPSAPLLDLDTVLVLLSFTPTSFDLDQ